MLNFSIYKKKHFLFVCRAEQAPIGGDLSPVQQPLCDHVLRRWHREALGRPHRRVHPELGRARLRRIRRRRMADPRVRHQAHLRSWLQERHRGDQIACPRF